MEEFSDGGSTPPASAKVLSRWLKTLVRHESAAPLCGDLGSAAQRAVPLCRFPPQMMKC